MMSCTLSPWLQTDTNIYEYIPEMGNTVKREIWQMQNLEDLPEKFIFLNLADSLLGSLLPYLRSFSEGIISVGTLSSTAFLSFHHIFFRHQNLPHAFISLALFLSSKKSATLTHRFSICRYFKEP